MIRPPSAMSSIAVNYRGPCRSFALHMAHALKGFQTTSGATSHAVGPPRAIVVSEVACLTRHLLGNENSARSFS